MKPIHSLPLDLDGLLHGKAVEWERLEFKEGLPGLRLFHPEGLQRRAR